MLMTADHTRQIFDGSCLLTRTNCTHVIRIVINANAEAALMWRDETHDLRRNQAVNFPSVTSSEVPIPPG